MATEPFLINPPKRLRRRSRKRNPIGETLVTIGANPMRKRVRRNPENPWYGDSEGHRIAALMRWGKISSGKISRHRRRRVKYKAVKKVRRVKRAVRRRRWAPAHIRLQRKMAQQAFWHTKYGEMLAHPRRKKYHFKTKGVKYYMKRLRRRNTWFGQPRRHRKAAKKGWRRGHLLVSGKRRRRVRHRNPMVASNPKRRSRRRHSVRSYRRRRSNPAIMAQLNKFSSGVMDIRSWAPLAVTGGLSAVTGAVVPGMLGITNPWMKYGAQTAVAIGGGIVVESFVDKRHGQAWMIVGVAMVGYQLLKEFVLQPYFPQFAVGLGEYESYYPVSEYANQDEVSQQVGAFPSLGAFPNAMSGYPGVGSDMGAYPYDGSGY